MKRVIIIGLTILLSFKIHAQTIKDYAYCNRQIDSLIQEYSIHGYISPIKINRNFSFKNAKLNIKEKKKLIDQIKKMFEQKQYSNLYALGSNLIRNMYSEQWLDNTVEINQLLMDIYLQYYFSSGMNTRLFHKINLESLNYYSPKGKKRLIELLENKKTKEEFELYLQFEKTVYSEYTSNIQEEARHIMKKREIRNDTVLKQISDSLLNSYVFQNAKISFESILINNELIQMIGLLGMKECIPVLKEKLQECIQDDCVEERKKAFCYALARLGDEEQRKYILDSLMDVKKFDQRDFLYFQDNEMIWKYIDVNYHSNKRFFPFSHGEGITMELKTMSSVYPYIKNLPERLKYPELSKDINDDYKWGKSLYEWLMVNKSTVEFDYEGEKKFPW